jgi:hypothetical protein
VLELTEVTYPLEETLAGTEENRDQVDLHLIHEASAQVLLRCVRPAGEGDVPATCRAPGHLESGLDALRDEGERRAPSSWSGGRAWCVSTKTGW